MRIFAIIGCSSSLGEMPTPHIYEIVSFVEISLLFPLVRRHLIFVSLDRFYHTNVRIKIKPAACDKPLQSSWASSSWCSHMGELWSHKNETSSILVLKWVKPQAESTVGIFTCVVLGCSAASAWVTAASETPCANTGYCWLGGNTSVTTTPSSSFQEVSKQAQHV